MLRLEITRALFLSKMHLSVFTIIANLGQFSLFTASDPIRSVTQMVNFSQCFYNYSKKSHILVLTNAISTYPNFSLNMSDLINFARFVTKRIEIVSKVVLRPRDRVTVWVKIVSKVVFRL